jgi:hypothetical protein
VAPARLRIAFDERVGAGLQIDQLDLYIAPAQDQQMLRQQLSAFNGAGAAMGTMYGSQFNPGNYARGLGNNPFAHQSFALPQQQVPQPPQPPPMDLRMLYDPDMRGESTNPNVYPGGKPPGPTAQRYFPSDPDGNY